MESIKNRYLEAVSACQKCVSVSFCFSRQRGIMLPVIHTANTVGPNTASVDCDIAGGLCLTFPVPTASTEMLGWVTFGRIYYGCPYRLQSLSFSLCNDKHRQSLCVPEHAQSKEK